MCLKYEIISLHYDISFHLQMRSIFPYNSPAFLDKVFLKNEEKNKVLKTMVVILNFIIKYVFA